MDVFALQGNLASLQIYCQRQTAKGHVVSNTVFFVGTLENTWCDTIMNGEKAIIGVKDAERGFKRFVDLLLRSEEGLLVVPWDVIDVHVRLVALLEKGQSDVSTD